MRRGYKMFPVSHKKLSDRARIQTNLTGSDPKIHYFLLQDQQICETWYIPPTVHLVCGKAIVIL